MDARLAKLLEAIIEGEGGPMSADKAAGVSRGTFSRWTTVPDLNPSAARLSTMATHLGQKYGFTAAEVLEWAGHLATVPATTEEAEVALPPGLKVGLSRARSLLSEQEYRLLTAIIESAVKSTLAAAEAGELGPTRYQRQKE